jgi:hypothetical protein
MTSHFKREAIAMWALPAAVLGVGFVAALVGTFLVGQSRKVLSSELVFFDSGGLQYRISHLSEDLARNARIKFASVRVLLLVAPSEQDPRLVSQQENLSEFDAERERLVYVRATQGPGFGHSYHTRGELTRRIHKAWGPFRVLLIRPPGVIEAAFEQPASQGELEAALASDEPAV